MKTTTRENEVAAAASSHKRPRGRWLMRFGLLLGAVAGSLVLCELATRWVVPQSSSWLAIYRRHPDLPFYGFQPNAQQRVDTGETHWTVFTNASGDRMTVNGTDEQPAQSGGVDATDAPTHPWALCLGDSFLFAHGVDHEESFVGKLQQDTVVGLDWVNAGVPGYCPVEYRHCLL
jgi:hypothetical protein